MQTYALDLMRSVCKSSFKPDVFISAALSFNVNYIIKLIKRFTASAWSSILGLWCTTPNNKSPSALWVWSRNSAVFCLFGSRLRFSRSPLCRCFRPKRNHRLQQLPSEIHQVRAQTHSTCVGSRFLWCCRGSNQVRLHQITRQIICVNVREKLNENFIRSSFGGWWLFIDQLSVKSFNEHKLQLDLIPSRSVFTELLPSFFCLLIKLI